jgi:squalene synthase HpnC
MIPWAFSHSLPRMGRWSLEESERICMNMTLSHYENFPVVAGIFGRDARRTLAAVYCFARYADDFSDEPCYDGVRLELLDGWERQLASCFGGDRPHHPVFIALKAAIERHGLDEGPFLDLLSAFRQDCIRQRYDSFDEVLDYCRRSAEPVGRIVLRVMNREDPWILKLSDRTCTALQLINFWQDLSVDMERGRLYIPRDLAEKHGLTIEDIVKKRSPSAFEDLLQELVDRTRNLMHMARELPAAVGLPGELYLRAVQEGGLSVLESVERMGASILATRPALTGLDKGLIFARSAGGAAKNLLGLSGLRIWGD